MFITGRDLRQMRLQAKKTTSAMANAAGVSTRKTYENWEQNIGQPKMNQFITLSIFCGQKPDVLIRKAVQRTDSEDSIIHTGVDIQKN